LEAGNTNDQPQANGHNARGNIGTPIGRAGVACHHRPDELDDSEYRVQATQKTNDD
jgi:hypothetical protein